MVGFVEAEGSFYITTKVSPSPMQGRMAHGFGISQKLDPVVLEAIRLILHIATKVRHNGMSLTSRVVRQGHIPKKLPLVESFKGMSPTSLEVRQGHKPKHGYYLLDTTNGRAVLNVCKFFEGHLKGMKSLEFAFWKKSLKFKGGCANYTKLLEAQTKLRSLRKLRPIENGEVTENLGDGC